MRLEQEITVRLSQGDVTQLKSRHTLTVACACGQHIHLAWDGQVAQANGTEPKQFSPRVLAHMRRAATTARAALAKKRAAAKRAEAQQKAKKARAKKLRAASTTKRRATTAKLLEGAHRVKSLKAAVPNFKQSREEPCSVCGKFFSRRGITMHLLRAHRGVGPQKGQPLVRKAAAAHAPVAGNA